jgi:hypothetical protein
MGKYDPVEFCGEMKHETDKAYLVDDGANEVWIPKSQCMDVVQIGGALSSEYEFTIPEWLAKEKGII